LLAKGSRTVYTFTLDLLHLLENMFDRKRISANTNPNPSPNSNPNLKNKAQ